MSESTKNQINESEEKNMSETKNAERAKEIQRHPLGDSDAGIMTEEKENVSNS